MLDKIKIDNAQSRISKTILLNGRSVSDKKQEIREYFHHSFTLYESLFETINNDEAYYLRPEPLRHPLIFYFGHTATFFINKLVLANYIDRRIKEDFESMFAIGVDEMSWDDLNDDHYEWPTVDEVRTYRNRVRDRVDQIIAKMPLQLPIAQDSIAWVILMGIEHERIHLETSSVIIRMLPLEHVSEHAVWPACCSVDSAPSNRLIPVSKSDVVLGKRADADTFGWDNEYGRKHVSVPAFKASKHLVSNHEFLQFVEAGGYSDEQYWTEEGVNWLRFSNVRMPRFWIWRNGRYFQRNMLQEIELPLNWPVEVNYLEAKAFCNWKNNHSAGFIRLPSEAEWYVLRTLIDTDQPHWEQAPGNLNLEYYASCCPVDEFETQGFFDIVGNVWQWTETAIDGYPGFKVHELYDDFSTPTFDGKHNIFKGGSWISTGNEATRHSRYAFRRHFFQHAGFRYVESESTELPVDKVNLYETDELVSRYLHFHFGETYFDVENYPVACVNACMTYMHAVKTKKVLDLGCSVGRSAFEFARYFDRVDAIDFSARFIQQGFKLLEEGCVRYTIPTEGELVAFEECNLSELGYHAVKHKIEFVQGDACNLKPGFRGYDLIFCGNLIDRLYDPLQFLQSILDRLNPGGFLILASPYTWLEEYTEKSKWLGGVKVNGENFTTLDGLKRSLLDHCELVDTRDIPFVIRETQRKFQYGVSQMTVWKLTE